MQTKGIENALRSLSGFSYLVCLWLLECMAERSTWSIERTDIHLKQISPWRSLQGYVVATSI